MFYHLNDLLGKVVTIKIGNGQEFIATLRGIDDPLSVLTLNKPKSIILGGNTPETQQVFMLPYMLTADQDEIFMSLSQVLSVVKTLEETAEEYKLLLLQEESEDVDVEVVDK